MIIESGNYLTCQQQEETEKVMVVEDNRENRLLMLTFISMTRQKVLKVITNA